ncbi:unnamed protein product [Amoebophrya sp. A120]|nr:unnamed protein product [Amoebophrya sp. A120]|eukprot:GSA120T00015369001.1
MKIINVIMLLQSFLSASGLHDFHFSSCSHGDEVLPVRQAALLSPGVAPESNDNEYANSQASGGATVVATPGEFEDVVQNQRLRCVRIFKGRPNAPRSELATCARSHSV